MTMKQLQRRWSMPSTTGPSRVWSKAMGKNTEAALFEKRSSILAQ